MEPVELVAEARAAGLRLVPGPKDSLVVRGPRQAARIVHELSWRKEEVLAVLHAEADAPRRGSGPGVGPSTAEGDRCEKNASGPPGWPVLVHQPEDWPGALADFAVMLEPGDLPPELRLGPGTVVVDRLRFVDWLRRDIGRGPRGPRALTGAMQADLHRLRDVLIGDAKDRHRST